MGPLFPLLVAVVGAQPAPERMAVLPVLVAAEGLVDVDQVFAAVEAAAAWRLGLRPMTVGDYYFHGGQELARRSLACGPDAACITRELRPMDAGLGLVVLVNGELDPPLVSVLLLDARRGAVAAEWAGQISGGPDAVRDAVQLRTSAALDKQGFLQMGRVRVRTSPAQAARVMDGATEPDLGTLDTFTLPPGPHRLHVSAPDHRPKQVEVEVRAAEVTDLEVRLEPEGGLLSSPWLWVGVGVVAVGAAAAVTAVAVGQQSPVCACVVTRDQPNCVCPP
ncbi:MAG: PEGA domain-containing protein [Deltaproteobacteria bacterium]|nr:PEGA domain-containing protein [Deltaproteobacteria bacterium]